MSQRDPFVSIDTASLSSATGGWNPFKAAWNTAKQIGHKAVDVAETGIDYVKQHPEILIQANRRAI